MSKSHRIIAKLVRNNLSLRCMFRLLFVGMLFGATSVNAQIVTPLTLSAEQITTKFQVDSTWHLIKGVIKEASGVLSRESNGYRLVATFPLSSFDTEMTSRDEKLRTVMHQDLFPNATIDFTVSGDTCPIATLSINDKCSVEAQGKITIAGKTLDLRIPVDVERDSQAILRIHAQTVLQWRAFGIDDPSILVAKLYEDVTVDFFVKVPYGSN
jgi:polyisoprenoid-binding protein YceI